MILYRAIVKDKSYHAMQNEYNHVYQHSPYLFKSERLGREWFAHREAQHPLIYPNRAFDEILVGFEVVNVVEEK